MSKHFVLNVSKELLTNEDIQQIEQEKQSRTNQTFILKEQERSKKIRSHINLKTNDGRILVKIDTQYKNSYRFGNGTNIRLERQFNNLNRRETEPINAIVEYSDYIPKGSEILIHHNSVHDTNRIFNYGNISDDLKNDVIYLSLPKEECYCYREVNSSTWNACYGFALAERVFEPYVGIIDGIEPTELKNTFYITTGDLKGLVVRTLKSCDYEMIFQDNDGRENSLIRIRHFENGWNEREEVVGVDYHLTGLVKKGKLLVGVNIKKAKVINK
jgi:hypothetical protein